MAMLRIKRERMQLGWSQTALAYFCGMSAGDISRIETGRLRPYPNQLLKISKVLTLAPESLLEDVDSAAERRHGIDTSFPGEAVPA
jgi:transcriptional regulator with XRE-family HTH domain